MKSTTKFLSTFLLVLCISPACFGDLAFTSISGGFAEYSAFMRGYRFEVFNPISVNQLGVFDLNSDGWTGEPTTFVGLYAESTMSPLASAEVAPTSSLDPTLFDNGSDVSGQYRFESIAPIVLLPGFYRVAANMADIDSTNFDVAFNLTPGGVNPNVGNFDGVRSDDVIDEYPGGIQFPGAIVTGGGFAFTTIPEPSSLAFLCLAGLSTALVNRRRS